MKAQLTNFEMEQRIHSLESLLDRTDMIGYAAARNTRMLQNQNQEYQHRKNELIRKYGHKEGNEFVVDPDGPELQEFLDELAPFGETPHEVELFTLPIKEAAGILSGRELLDTYWMFEEQADA